MWRGTVAERRATGKIACAISRSVLAVLGLGFALGVRHALDADHVAAVSTLVARSRGMRASSLAGAAWGLGHTLALVVVALSVVFLEIRLPARMAPLLELAVAAMLVVLGLDLLRRRSVPVPVRSSSRRPFLIGVLHGLAGSASLMLAVLAAIPERWAALGYVAAFGLGSLGGMAAMSAALSVPLGRLPSTLGTTAAVTSIAVGTLLALDVGRATGWLT
jgi:high-affinity nickel-transport protein